MFKSLSAVVFMMVAGCASETTVNDQITDSVTQTPAVPTDATSPVADVTVTATPTTTTCQDGSTPVDGVCPGVGTSTDTTSASTTSVTSQTTSH